MWCDAANMQHLEAVPRSRIIDCEEFSRHRIVYSSMA